MEVLFDNIIGKGVIENGILYLRQYTEIINKKNAEEFLNLRINTIGGRSFPTVGDYRGVKQVTKEARDIYSSPKGHTGINSIALLMDPKIGVYIAKFFIKFNSPKVPTKIFTNEEEAYKWVSQFCKN